jgi:hypothetical protein
METFKSSSGLSGVFNWIDFLKTTFGGEAAITMAAISAEADPTAANVRAVLTAYAQAGKIPSADLVSHLKEINEARYPNDPAFPNYIPWLLFGGALLLFLKKR